MIKFETIKKAQCGDSKAIKEILQYYKKIIKTFSNDEDFMQIALIKVYICINKFKILKIFNKKVGWAFLLGYLLIVRTLQENLLCTLKDE